MLLQNLLFSSNGAFTDELVTHAVSTNAASNHQCPLWISLYVV